MNRLLFFFLLVALPIVGADDTVKTVTNGQTPAPGGKNLVLIEDLRFGADEEDEEFLWALDTTVVDADDRGHIFVGDPKDSRLLEFDANGAFVRRVIGQGEGPGETRALGSFQFLKDGRLVVLDGRPGILPRIHYFDKDLKFVEVKNPIGFSNIPISANFSPLGDRFAATYMSFNMEASAMDTMTGVMDTNYKVLKKFSTHSQTTNFQQFADPAVLNKFITEILQNAFAGVGVMAFDQQGMLYSAISSDYEITKWDKDLQKKTLIIKRDYKPVLNPPEDIRVVTERLSELFRQAPGLESVINDAFVEKVIEKADLPVVKNPVNGLICLPDGHLLVVHVVHEKTMVQVGDVFSPEGKFLGQITTKGASLMTSAGAPRMVFKKDFAYTVETDMEENNRVVRYKYAFK